MSVDEIRAETEKYRTLMQDVIARGIVLRRNLMKDFSEEVAVALTAWKEASERN